MADCVKIITIPLHIGDWEQSVSHMNPLEEGVYWRLVRRYYSDRGMMRTIEQCYRICGAITEDERQAVRFVLSDKFTATDGGFIHDRCDKTIADIDQASEKYRKRAKAAAEKRWADDATSNATSNATSTPQAMLEQCQPITNNQYPITNSQKPILEGDKSPKKDVRRGCRFENSGIHGLPAEWENFAYGEGMTLQQIEREFETFSDYWKAKTGPNATKTDWLATWRNWIRNNRNGKSNHNGARQSDTDRKIQQMLSGAEKAAYNRQ